MSAIAAFVGLLRRQSWGPTLAAMTGIATITGLALFHALPFQTEVTEPYWGDGVTNAPQVLSLVAVVATAAWLVNEASATLQARRGTVDVARP